MRALPGEGHREVPAVKRRNHSSALNRKCGQAKVQVRGWLRSGKWRDKGVAIRTITIA